MTAEPNFFRETEEVSCENTVNKITFHVNFFY